MASSASSEKPAIGILSIGDMGMGVAKLLLANNYPVYTSSAGRSQHTVDRIRSANITDVATDEELVAQVDIILSIVPPRDALATAKRIADASKNAADQRKEKRGPISPSIIYVDLNAVSPRTISNIAAMIDVSHVPTPPPVGASLVRRITRTLSSAAVDPKAAITAPPITLKALDGGIIGGPPGLQPDKTWKVPSMPVSGPQNLLDDDLMAVLNMKHISNKLGTASTLKACFASLLKGYTAIAALSFTTAQTAGILPELQSHLADFFPQMLKQAESSLTHMPPKAYRWVDEMQQIGETFASVGGLKGGREAFSGIAELYRFVADDTELGQEKIGKRKRGTTSEDVANAIVEGVEKKRGKKETEEGKEKLELAWKGSWS